MLGNGKPLAPGLTCAGMAKKIEEITLEVSGYPPAKNEARSLLGPRHPHRDRVLVLLRTARRTLNQGFQPFTEFLGLDVVVRAPEGDLWDATNYLGGIGDVLEDKTRRGSLPHLGDLSQVAVYGND